jgi:hypothetical protein
VSFLAGRSLISFRDDGEVISLRMTESPAKCRLCFWWNAGLLVSLRRIGEDWCPVDGGKYVTNRATQKTDSPT